MKVVYKISLIIIPLIIGALAYCLYVLYSLGLKDYGHYVYQIKKGNKTEFYGKGLEHWETKLAKTDILCQIWHWVFIINAVIFVAAVVWVIWQVFTNKKHINVL